MRELVPGASAIAVLINPSSPVASAQSQEMQAAAQAFGPHVLHANTEREFEPVFASLRPLQVNALVIIGDPLFNSRSEQLAMLASRYAVPTSFQFREFTAAGGLISYGSDLSIFAPSDRHLYRTGTQGR